MSCRRKTGVEGELLSSYTVGGLGVLEIVRGGEKGMVIDSLIHKVQFIVGEGR